MKAIALEMLLLVACTSPPHTIAVTGEPELGHDAIDAWSALGFSYTEGPADITIRVRREAYVSDDCRCEVLGHADPDALVIWIDPGLHGDELRHTARHEFGHILLDAMHLESYPSATVGYSVPGGYGIMNASPYRDGVPTWLLEPTADDFALACYTLGVCNAVE